MMRQSFRGNAARKVVSQSVSVGAPVGGLNARDSLATMPASDAITLDNMFPERSYVELRNGYLAHVTGLSWPVETLMQWAGPSPKMFAVAGNQIYDATTAGVAGAALVTGLANSRFQHVQFANTGGNYLVCVNGADGVRTYNGTTWATSAITIAGVAFAGAANFITVTSWKSRLWFGLSGTTKVYYGGTDAIAGDVALLDLGGVWRLGGTIAGVLSASFDSAGTGVSEYIGFVSTQGEIALYAGTDPASPSTFARVGNFRLGPPVGRRFFAQLGGDMALITSEGVVSLMQSMQIDRSEAVKFAVTDKIDPLFSAAYTDFASSYGWQVLVYPRGHRLIVNIPQAGEPSIQYVMNTLSGAWCRYTGHNALSWCLLGDDLHFAGADGVIYKADSGQTDNTAGIPYSLRKSFQDFGTRRKKRFVRIRPLVTASSQPNPTMAMDVDYRKQDVANVALSPSSASLWDTAVWDVDVWGGAPEPFAQWAGLSGIGYVGSIRMDGLAKNTSLSVSAFDVVFEPADGVTP